MEPTSSNQPGSAKPVGPPPVTYEAARLNKGDEGRDTSPKTPPPPVWTRYIDSRLKQFCTR